LGSIAQNADARVWSLASRIASSSPSLRKATTPRTLIATTATSALAK
jgi:hypothetical protein